MTQQITSNQKQALCDKLITLADDELMIAHRNSEWTGHGPILEEDIAFTNIALDELGHARIWYTLYGDLTGDEVDQLIFHRDPEAYRNVQMMELPKGDWAFSMLRQYLFDTAEMIHLTHLAQSQYQPLADAAAKIRSEEIYHVRHTHHWVKRLGLGTEESHRRMQDALDTLWAYAQQLFVPLPNDGLLIEAGMVPDTAVLHFEWHNIVKPHLQNSGLTIPVNDTPPTTSRAQHSDYLAPLLTELQEVARAHPEAQW